MRGRNDTRVWTARDLVKVFNTTRSFAETATRSVELDRTKTTNPQLDIERMRSHFKDAPKPSNKGNLGVKRKFVSVRCNRCQQTFEAKVANRKFCPACVPNSNDQRFLERYGLNIEDLSILLGKQGNRCAICETHFDEFLPRKDGRKTFNVDHDHSTGQVRGLLCTGCNALMAALDKPGWLAKAQVYKNGKND